MIAGKSIEEETPVREESTSGNTVNLFEGSIRKVITRETESLSYGDGVKNVSG